MSSIITALSNFIHTAIVFIYSNAPLILAIVLVLFALNIIRTSLVKRRRRNAMKRRALAKKSQQNVDWNMLSKL